MPIIEQEKPINHKAMSVYSLELDMIAREWVFTPLVQEFEGKKLKVIRYKIGTTKKHHNRVTQWTKLSKRLKFI